MTMVGLRVFIRSIGVPSAVFVLFCLLYPFPALGESKRIQKGELVDFDFTCRLPGGDVLVSTEEAILKDSSVKRSSVLVPRNVPVRIEAGATGPGPIDPLDHEFEQILAWHLASKLVGMRVGEKHRLELDPQGIELKRTSEQVIEMARVRQRPKTLRMTPEDYTKQTGKEAEVGEPFVYDPDVPGKVAAVSESQVLIEFTVEVGSVIDTAFGKATVKDSQDQYLIAIEPIRGSLVRSGPYVGLITGVDEEKITIDYGLPFAGQALSCDVYVRAVLDEESAAKEGGL